MHSVHADESFPQDDAKSGPVLCMQHIAVVWDAVLRGIVCSST